MKMKHTFGLATALMAVMVFGSLAMANTPKAKTVKASVAQTEPAQKDNNTMMAKTPAKHRKHGRKSHRTVARHTKTKMNSSTNSAAPRKS